MTTELITLVLFLGLLVLMATGFPVAFAMVCLSALGYVVFVGPQALYTLFSNTYVVITRDIYIAIPMFILMASLLETSGLGSALYDMMHKWAGGLRGGLAIATIGVCTLIAAMSGVAATGTVTMGIVAYPEMRQRGYNKFLSIGCITVGGALGPLIPPSVLMIVVAGFTNLSAGKMFIGGVLPGILMSFLFIAYIVVLCFFKPHYGPPIPREERASWKEKVVSLRKSLLPIVLIIVVLGGIYIGAFTPTEAGGIGAAGAIACAAIYKNLSWKNVKQAIITSFQVNCMIMWLVIGGASFASLCGAIGVTRVVSNYMLGLPLSPTGIIIVMMVIVFIFGMFIDTLALTMITIPIFTPIVVALGFDLLWFGLLFTINLIVGMVSPPFGYNLFYFKGLGHADVTMADIFTSVWPYVALMMIVLIVSFVFPPILIWLPNTMIK